MPSFSACMRTRVELESRLCVTSSELPCARASSIWLESAWDCMEVVTVAAERVRLAMPTRAKTAMTMIAAFSTRPGVTVEAGAAERVRWPGTTEMRVRGARSTARSG